MRARSNIKRRYRRKKFLKIVKGQYGQRHRLYRTAKEAAYRSGKHGYHGRKLKKRDYRAMWIVRLGGALTGKEINYSRFINALKKANITLNRKWLSEIAIHDPSAFDKIVEIAKASKANAN